MCVQGETKSPHAFALAVCCVNTQVSFLPPGEPYLAEVLNR